MKGNKNYNREKAKAYAEKYALSANPLYPFYSLGGDCANFISQVLKAGGLDEIGEKWNDFNAWFCHTSSEKDLKNTAITWRAARYFRRHWGNENGIGRNRAAFYTEMKVIDAIKDFDNLYNMLFIGDIVQYGDPLQNNYPYHTQVIHEKGFNLLIERNDLFMAQHSKNRKNVSFYKYLTLLDHPDKRYVYIYRIKESE